MQFLFALLLFAGAATPTPQQVRLIHKLEDRLMAPCCYSQTIDVHMSAEAEQMREEVTSMVLAGQSEQQIVQYYKAKYGETILVVPDGAAGKFTYTVPVGVFLLASGLLIFGIYRSLRNLAVKTPAVTAASAEILRPDLITKIRKELSGEL